MKLTNDDYSIISHDWFVFQGKKLKVHSTRSTGNGIFDTIDTIKNLDTGKLTEINRKKLSELEIEKIEPINLKKSFVNIK